VPQAPAGCHSSTPPYLLGSPAGRPKRLNASKVLIGQGEGRNSHSAPRVQKWILWETSRSRGRVICILPDVFINRLLNEYHTQGSNIETVEQYCGDARLYATELHWQDWFQARLSSEYFEQFALGICLCGLRDQFCNSHPCGTVPLGR